MAQPAQIERRNKGMADSLSFGHRSPRRNWSASCSPYCSLGTRWKESRTGCPAFLSKFIVIGGKDRLVPVHNSVIEYLRSYSAQLPDEREWFFPSACGHYSIKTIYDNFRELLFACNIPHTGNGPRVHDFRHTFAVHTLEKQLSDGYDPMVIVPRLAAYLGHKSYRETCWYIHLTVASFPELSQKLDRAFVGIIPVGGETDEEN